MPRFPVDRKLIDLKADLHEAVKLSGDPARIDALLAEALDALAGVVPYDLATIMQLAEGGRLRTRLWRGALSRPEIADMAVDLDRFPSVRRVMEGRRAQAFLEADHRDGDGDLFDGVLDLPHGHSCMVVPLFVDKDDVGIMTFDRKVCEPYPQEVVKLGTVYGQLIGLALTYCEQSSLLRRIGLQLKEQNKFLLDQLEAKSVPTELLESSTSPGMRQVIELAKQVAKTDAPVLITGETGTGKEVLAKAIHAWSDRRDRPMLSINCAALPPDLIESELFGHKKGAFSGALTSRPGRFQVANGGTLLLDEIGELPIKLQAKLLRVLQEGTFDPVGSDETVRVDVRVIAATHVNLAEAVAQGRFREDIFYRLNVFPLGVPPLRDRREDIPALVRQCLHALHVKTGRGPWTISSAGMMRLQGHSWSGNVRELLNVLERATIVAPGPGTLTLPLLEEPTRVELGSQPTPHQDPPVPEAALFPTLEELERQHFADALRRAAGRLYGPGGAAELLGLNPSTAKSRMVKLGLGGVREFKKRARES